MGGVLGQPPQGGVDLLPTLKTPTHFSELDEQHLPAQDLRSSVQVGQATEPPPRSPLFRPLSDGRIRWMDVRAYLQREHDAGRR